MPAHLTADDVRTRVRTQLLRTDHADRFAERHTFDYARPLSDGLMVGLCLDFPDDVVTITDEALNGLPLGEEELFAFGQLNTDKEPVDERREVMPGLYLVAGESFFVAAKAANFPGVLGSVPYGVLFTVPQRHLLLALPVTGEQTLPMVQHLLGATVQVITGAQVPGGVLSPDVHFSRGGEVTRMTSVGDDGRVVFAADARLGQAFEDALSGR
ncbi:hypothetical protein ACWGJ9_11225 [Curtobacterium citreum]